MCILCVFKEPLCTLLHLTSKQLFQEVGRSNYYFQGCGNSWERLGNLSQAPRLHEVAKFTLEPRSTTVSLYSSNAASFFNPKTEHNYFHPTTATKIMFIWGRE